MKFIFALGLAAIGTVGISAPAIAQSNTFSVRKCVNRLSREVDRPYRISVPLATDRCNSISSRISALSSQIVGSWSRRDGQGRPETITFLANGTANERVYSSATRRIQETAKPWTFVNPYGTLGAEVLEFYPYLVGVTFSGGSMNIEHQPASSAYTERWSRLAVGASAQRATPPSGMRKAAIRLTPIEETWGGSNCSLYLDRALKTVVGGWEYGINEPWYVGLNGQRYKLTESQGRGQKVLLIGKAGNPRVIISKIGTVRSSSSSSMPFSVDSVSVDISLNGQKSVVQAYKFCGEG